MVSQEWVYIPSYDPNNKIFLIPFVRVLNTKNSFLLISNVISYICCHSSTGFVITLHIYMLYLETTFRTSSVVHKERGNTEASSKGEPQKMRETLSKELRPLNP